MPILRVLKMRPALDQNTANWHFGQLAWMTNTFGSPYLPRVPSVLQRYESLAETAFNEEDTRTSEDWAQDLFGRIVNECHMEDWTLSCRPMPDAPDDGLHAFLLSSTWHRMAPGSYHVDILGNPVVIYNADKVSEPGAIALSFILQLATLRLASAPVPDDYNAEDHARLLVEMAVYNAQGLELMAMADMLADHLVQQGLLRQRDVSRFLSELEFTTILGMRTRNLAPEQIVATYGPLLTRTFRKRVWNLVEELNSYGPEMKLMQRLASGKDCAEHAQLSLREVVSA